MKNGGSAFRTQRLKTIVTQSRDLLLACKNIDRHVLFRHRSARLTLPRQWRDRASCGGRPRVCFLWHCSPSAAAAKPRSAAPAAAAPEEVLPNAVHTLQPTEGGAEVVEHVAEAEEEEEEPSGVDPSGGAEEEEDVQAVKAEEEMTQVEEEIAEVLQPSVEIGMACLFVRP